jgi:flagellar biosynthesis protein FlhF
MRIKTYVVDNVNEAYPLIKNDLGKDAFILKTKPLKKSGLLGLFQKKQFEVVAAADDSQRPEKETRAPLLNESEELKRFEDMIDSLVPKSPVKTAELDHAQKILEALKNNNNAKKQLKLKPSIQAQENEMNSIVVQVVTPEVPDTTVEALNAEQTHPAPKKRGRPKKSQVLLETEVPIEAPKKKRGRPKKVVEPISAEPALDASENQGSPTKPQEEVKLQDSHQEVLKELSEVKELIQAMAGSEQPSKMIPKLLEKWVDQLRDHEVDEEVIQFIIKRVCMKHQNLESISTHLLEQTVLGVIEQLFHEGVDKHTNSAESFIALVGPTGVGKTTTIAKLAAAQVIEKRQKVGLLTTDTFRIAAVEQLKTYANILNAPFGVVDKANELVPAMQSLKGCDIVFMDSAGRNYLEGEYIEEINQYLRLDVPQENYLVLSMTTRWRDMKKIVEQMKAVPIDKLILTKWDETTCFGVALNMVYHYPYPLSYLCLGQGVPDDIMKADPKFMAKKLLGVDDSETGPSTSFKTII